MGKMTLDEVRTAIAELTEEEQSILYQDMAAATQKEAPELSPEWRSEIKRRIEEIESGSAVLLDGDEVMAELQALIDEKI